ncbi:DUF2487 family protein [Brevibacillus fortis]|uniref:DUF2487 domain-containing protein n=1 Tax=Brevibacillus fortis TaxID=2126352 RepID=A0A2P7VKK9_9BACL|nr:DUF2487 family protein [Brevibacillus fortis]MED1782440.1 DUF2487 family protein [Brevibacillus fortis]PSJ99763.1 hypothetical protein C7R93_03590 [Brevibacillus fortis]
MQWNLNDFENWEELRSFVDTALLPLYLYSSDRKVEEHVVRTNYLLNVAAGIEQRLKGRVLLFPLSYQIAEEQLEQRTPAEFLYKVVLHFRGEQIQLKERSEEGVLTLMVGDEDLDSSLRFEVTVDVLYKEVIKMWQTGRG